MSKLKNFETHFLAYEYIPLWHIEQSSASLKKLQNLESFESCILSDTIIRNVDELKQMFRMAASLSGLKKLAFCEYLPRRKKMKVLAVHMDSQTENEHNYEIDPFISPNIRFLIENPTINISQIYSTDNAFEDIAVRIVSKAGVFFLTAKHSCEWQEIRDLSTLAILWGLISRSMHAMELIKRGFTDRLTKLYNRAALDKFIDEQQDIFDYVVDGEKVSGVCFIDLDDFKKINDTYGHAIGDDILKKVSEIIHKKMGKKHLFYRYGGDEVVGVLFAPKTKKGQAKIEQEMRNLSSTITSHPVAYDEKNIPIYISLSIGLSFAQEDFTLKHIRKKHEVFTRYFVSLLRKADEAMYSSKIAGKNHLTAVHVGYLSHIM